MDDRKTWVIDVGGTQTIYFYNSIGGRSGPWRWDPRSSSIHDRAGVYPTMRVSDALADRLRDAVSEAWTSQERQMIPYSTDDIQELTGEADAEEE